MENCNHRLSDVLSEPLNFSKAPKKLQDFLLRCLVSSFKDSEKAKYFTVDVIKKLIDKKLFSIHIDEHKKVITTLTYMPQDDNWVRGKDICSIEEMYEKQS